MYLYPDVLSALLSTVRGDNESSSKDYSDEKELLQELHRRATLADYEKAMRLALSKINKHIFEEKKEWTQTGTTK